MPTLTITVCQEMEEVRLDVTAVIHYCGGKCLKKMYINGHVTVLHLPGKKKKKS